MSDWWDVRKIQPAIVDFEGGKTGFKPRNVPNHLEAGEGKKMASPQSPERKTALLTSWFYPSETHLGLWPPE